MALTRKLLKSMGIEDEKIDQIIEAHTETVDGLRDRLDKAEAGAKDLPALQKKLEDAEAALETAKKDGWKDKHDVLKKQFEDYKAEIDAKETGAAKEKAARAYFEGKNITGKNLDLAMRAARAEIDAVEMDGERIKDTAALDELIRGDFAGLVSKTTVKGADTAKPPAGSGTPGKMTRDEIYKKDDKGRYVLSTEERQKAIAENLDQFT